MIALAMLALSGCSNPSQPGVGSPMAAAPTPAPVSVRSPRQYPIEAFIGSTALSGATFSADESRILFSANRRSEEHTSELQSLMSTTYAVFCLKKKKKTLEKHYNQYHNKIDTTQ